MPQIARLALVSVLVAAGCPGDDEVIPPTPIDAPVDAATIDTPSCVDCDGGPTDGPTPIDMAIDAASSVMVVTCPTVGTEDLAIAINAGGNAYVPSAGTIPVNGVVRFDPNGTNHDMDSGTPGNANGLFNTPTGQITCLRFTAAGTFPFFCSVHSFPGTLTVQ